MEPTLPIRPEAHEIGDVAVRQFQVQVPASWVVDEFRRDYGIDLRVTLPLAMEDRRVGDFFTVQLKGTSSPTFVSSGEYLSQSLKTSTFRWLTRKTEPTMVAVCSERENGSPIYYQWVDAALADISSRQPGWALGETVSLHIPVTQVLTRDHEAIHQHVTQAYEEIRLARAMVQVVLPLGRRAGLCTSQSALPDEMALRQHLRSALSISDSLEAPTDTPLPEDVEIRDALQRAVGMLRVLNDVAAASELEKVEAKVETCHSTVRALFLNCKGIQALHSGDSTGAASWFARALASDPSNPKYATNLLVTEWELANERKENLPGDWADRLARVRRSHPAFDAAVALDVRYTAAERDLDAAIDLARESGFASRNAGEASFALAQAAMERGEYQRAASLLEQSPRAGAALEASALSLRAYVLLRLAVPLARDDNEGGFDGLGPSRLDAGLLKASAGIYRDACAAFARLGYPSLAAETFCNAATVLVLAGHPDEAADYCHAFLEHHPADGHTNSAMAMALTHAGRGDEAVPFAERAFEGIRTSRNFKNLLLSLIQADMHDRVVELVSTRSSQGFTDTAERALSLELLSLALSEMGRYAEAERVAQELSSENESSLAAHGIIALTNVARRQGAQRPSVLASIQDGLSRFPNEPYLLSCLVPLLLPVTRDSAGQLISVITALAGARQLVEDEAGILAEAHLILGDLASAERVLAAAADRFPEQPRFLANHAGVLHQLGREQDAWTALRRYLDIGKRSYGVYRNLGHLSTEIGRLDDAVQFFNYALGKAKTSEERGEIHCQLYELRRRRGDPVKERLRHVVQYGMTTGGETESEAKYLLMFFATPTKENDWESDGEMRGWVLDFRRRLERFAKAHPRFHALRRIQAPEGLSDAESANHLLVEAIALTLPARMRRGLFEIAVRGTPWPIAIRQHLLGAGSIFDYWSFCTSSGDYANSVHTLTDTAVLEREVAVLEKGRSAVCLDISALLTLWALGLLDEATSEFGDLLISSGTRHAIEYLHPFCRNAHPAALALQRFLSCNRARIRVRHGTTSHDGGPMEFYEQRGGLWIHKSPSIVELIGDGVGESIVVAGEAGAALWSDDVVVRDWARTDFGVERTFCTLGLLRYLRLSGRLSLRNETVLLVRLLELNYRVVAFAAEHLHECIRMALEANEGGDLNREDISSHPALSRMLSEYIDPHISEESLLAVMGNCWVLLLQDEQVSNGTLSALLAAMTYRLCQRRPDGVLSRQWSEKLLVRSAGVLAAVLWRTYQSDTTDIPRVWSILKTSAESLYPLDEAGSVSIVVEK